MEAVKAILNYNVFFHFRKPQNPNIPPSSTLIVFHISFNKDDELSLLHPIINYNKLPLYSKKFHHKVSHNITLKQAHNRLIAIGKHNLHATEKPK